MAPYNSHHVKTLASQLTPKGMEMAGDVRWTAQLAPFYHSCQHMARGAFYHHFPSKGYTKLDVLGKIQGPPLTTAVGEGSLGGGG